MAVLARIALPGIVVLSALGAALMCLLVVRYGLGLTEDDDADEMEHRGVVMRLGHAVAGVCFACVAMLAVVAGVARPPVRAPAAEPPPAAAKPEETTSAVRTAEHDEALLRLEQRLSTEIAALEERVSEAEAAARAAPARADAKPAEPPASAARARADAKLAESPALPARAADGAPAPAPSRRRAGPPPTISRPARGENTVAALPADIGEPKLSATVEGVRLDVHARSGGGKEAVYTIRLVDAANRPMTGADVTLVAHTADGAPVRTVLEPSGEPGIYRGRIPAGTDAPDLRLRVVHRDKRFEVSLAQGVSW